jgi:glutamyl-tRNA reductase
MNVVVIGLSHRSAPVELRERFAFAESKIPGALKSLRDSGIAGEAVILSTCNRVEIYAATPLEPAKAFAELKIFLLRWGEISGEPSAKDNPGSRGRSPHREELYS